MNHPAAEDDDELVKKKTNLVTLDGITFKVPLLVDEEELPFDNRDHVSVSVYEDKVVIEPVGDTE